MQDLTTIRFRNPSKQWLVYSVKQQIYKWLNRRVAKKSAHIITPTEFVKQDVAQFTHIPLEKITVTLEAADPLPPPTPPPLQNLQKDSFIMYVGRPFPHKNLWRLIEAHGELQKTRPSLQLVLAGKKDPLYAAIEERVHAEGRSGIIFAGFVSDAEMHWLYQHCRAYVAPSLSEGFGLPGLEAMLHGAPVVSSNATCSPEVYGSGAHYFDPFSVSDMAKSIGNVIDNQKLRERLIEAGKKQAAKYSWERMARQTLAVYNKVLSHKDKPGTP